MVCSCQPQWWKIHPKIFLTPCKTRENNTEGNYTLYRQSAVVKKQKNFTSVVKVGDCEGWREEGGRTRENVGTVSGCDGIAVCGGRCVMFGDGLEYGGRL
jgi:hypothetical protein